MVGIGITDISIASNSFEIVLARSILRLLYASFPTPCPNHAFEVSHIRAYIRATFNVPYHLSRFIVLDCTIRISSETNYNHEELTCTRCSCDSLNS